MATKNKPGAYDCYKNAEPDEPMFVLLARDPVAPLLVRLWCEIRHLLGKTDETQIIEAEQCALAMVAWRHKNREITKTDD